MYSTEELLNRARTDLLSFIVFIMPNYEVAPHHRLICDKITKMLNTPNGRLMISLPPRHGKSMIISEFLPAFILGRQKEEIIAASYSSLLSTNFGKKVRRIINSPEYKILFPGVEVLGDGESGSKFELSNDSTYRAVGRGGSTTGFNSTLTLADDVIKDSQEAKSDKILDSLVEWYDTTLASRSLPGGKIIVMGTRWSEKDLQGYLLANEPEKWDILSIPALCDDPDNDPLGRQDGEALWKEWYPEDYLLPIKKRNPYQFSALYQGNPVAKEGNYFNIKKFKPVDIKLDKFDCTFMSFDTASSTNDTSCYTSGVLIGVKDRKAYILDMVKKRVKFPELITTVKNCIKLYNPDYLLIEDASSGTQLIQLLETERLATNLVKLSKAKSKDQKVQNLLYAFENDLIVFNTEIIELVDELTAYPFGSFDDGVIALAHAINWLFLMTNNLNKDLYRPKHDVFHSLNKFFTKKRRNLNYGVTNQFSSGKKRKSFY